MKIEELLGYSTGDLELLTEAELEVKIGHHYQYTRPERLDLEAISKTTTKKPKEKKAVAEAIERIEKVDAKAKMMEIMKAAGVDNKFTDMLKGKI